MNDDMNDDMDDEINHPPRVITGADKSEPEAIHGDAVSDVTHGHSMLMLLK